MVPPRPLMMTNGGRWAVALPNLQEGAGVVNGGRVGQWRQGWSLAAGAGDSTEGGKWEGTEQVALKGWRCRACGSRQQWLMVTGAADGHGAGRVHVRKGRVDGRAVGTCAHSRRLWGMYICPCERAVPLPASRLWSLQPV